MPIRAVIKKNDFPVLPAKGKQGIRNGMGQLAQPLLSYMRPRTAKDTGALQRSARANIRGDALYITSGKGLPDARALYVERGTVHMQARPFMSLTMTSNTRLIEEKLGSNVRTSLS